MDAGSHKVVGIDPAADARWDALVRRDRFAGAYHLGAWARVLERAYGDRPAYLALEAADGTLLGGLPVMRTRGLMTGLRMRTLPVLPPAGPLADSDDDLRLLLEAGCRATDAEGARIWTIHSRRDGLDRLVPELHPHPKHPTFVLPLGSDPEELRGAWKKSSKNVFRSIRKAEKAGVTVREGVTDDDLRDFYTLYARTMRRRRVLPRPYVQLRAARDLLPPGVLRLFLAEYEDRVVAGSLHHSFGGTLDLLYQGSDEDYLEHRPNHALYWQSIRWATATGHTELDLGHAKPGSGLADFKEQWGAEPVPEYRYDYVPGGSDESQNGSATRTPASLAEGRESDSVVARAIERMPLPVLRAAARVAHRRL